MLEFLHYQGPNSASSSYLYRVLYIFKGACSNDAGLMHAVSSRLKEAGGWREVVDGQIALRLCNLALY